MTAVGNREICKSLCALCFSSYLPVRGSAAVAALPEHVFLNAARALCIVEDTYVQSVFNRIALRGTNASRVVFVGKSCILSDSFVASKHVDAALSWDVVFPVQILIRHEETMVLAKLFQSGMRIPSVTTHTWSADADEALVTGWARTPEEAAVTRALKCLA